MDLVAYAAEAEVEESHWWFVGRRQLFAKEIERLGLSRDARVLDVGTSTGTNIRLLRELGFRHVVGLDYSVEAIRFCEAKGLGPVRQGDICALPFDDGAFDLVLATDVIEHVTDDGQATREIARVLAPGGRALVTVPTFASLWGLQDERSHHRRRYRIARLRALLEASGLRIVSSYYFNYLLFVPIGLARKVISLARISLHSEGQVNTPLLNKLLKALFWLDIITAPTIRPPFGVSALALCEKTRER